MRLKRQEVRLGQGQWGCWVVQSLNSSYPKDLCGCCISGAHLFHLGRTEQTFQASMQKKSQDE